MQQGLNSVFRKNASILTTSSSSLDHFKRLSNDVQKADSKTPVEELPKVPYSPFQNKTNLVEFALARIDDVLNWGRKGIYLLYRSEKF